MASEKDIFDTGPETLPEVKPKRKPGLLTRKPESLAKPKNDPNELRRVRKAAAAKLKEEQAGIISILIGAGIPKRTIARILKITVRYMQKYFSEELDGGGHEATAKIATTLYSLALAGNMPAITLWLRSRANWQEKTSLEVSVEGRDLSDVERSQRLMHIFMKNPQARSIMEQQSLATAEEVNKSPAIKILNEVFNPKKIEAPIDITPTNGEDEDAEEN